MKLQELTDLIAVRSYVVSSSGNGALDRGTVKYMNGILLLIDKKIISLLQANDFKEYIQYQDLQKAIADVVSVNNIKSGLQYNPQSGQLEKISK